MVNRGLFKEANMRLLMQTLIWFYRGAISPLLPQTCRYYPSCSAFMQQAIKRHGFLKGGILGFLRIISCHPLSRRPFHDPVPEVFAWGAIFGYKRGDCCPHHRNDRS